MYVAPDQSRTPVRRPHWSSRYPWLFLSVWCVITIGTMVGLEREHWGGRITEFLLKDKFLTDSLWHWLFRRSYDVGADIGLIIGFLQALLLPCWSGWPWRKLLWISAMIAVAAGTFDPLMDLGFSPISVACGALPSSLWQLVPIIGMGAVGVGIGQVLLLVGWRDWIGRRLVTISMVAWVVGWGWVFLIRYQQSLEMTINMNCGALK